MIDEGHVDKDNFKDLWVTVKAETQGWLIEVGPKLDHCFLEISLS